MDPPSSFFVECAKQPSFAPCAPVDQVSILPFDLIGFTSDSGGLSQLHIIRVVRLLRMLKLIRVLKVNRQGASTWITMADMSTMASLPCPPLAVSSNPSPTTD